MNASAIAAVILAQTYVEWLDPRSQNLTLEQKMTVIDAGGHLVAADDVTIVRFRFLLTSLETSPGLTASGSPQAATTPRRSTASRSASST